MYKNLKMPQIRNNNKIKSCREKINQKSFFYVNASFAYLNYSEILLKKEMSKAKIIKYVRKVAVTVVY